MSALCSPLILQPQQRNERNRLERSQSRSDKEERKNKASDDMRIDRDAEGEREVTSSAIVSSPFIRNDNADDQDDPEEGIEEKVCRICYGGSREGVLISPCRCSGGLRWVHDFCLRKWIEKRPTSENAPGTYVCEICHTTYRVTITRKFAWENWARGLPDLFNGCLLTMCFVGVFGMCTAKQSVGVSFFTLALREFPTFLHLRSLISSFSRFLLK